MLGAFFGRPDGIGSSDFAQHVHFFMLYRSIWVSGVDVMKIIDFLAEEGSKFVDCASDKSAEIRLTA